MIKTQNMESFLKHKIIEIEQILKNKHNMQIPTLSDTTEGALTQIATTLKRNTITPLPIVDKPSENQHVVLSEGASTVSTEGATDLPSESTSEGASEGAIARSANNKQDIVSDKNKNEGFQNISYNDDIFKTTLQPFILSDIPVHPSL